MGHPGDSYVLRAGKNKDILLDIPTGQGGLLLLPSRFARSFGSRDKKFCSKVKGIGFLLHI